MEGATPRTPQTHHMNSLFLSIMVPLVCSPSECCSVCDAAAWNDDVGCDVAGAIMADKSTSVY